MYSGMCDYTINRIFFINQDVFFNICNKSHSLKFFSIEHSNYDT